MSVYRALRTVFGNRWVAAIALFTLAAATALSLVSHSSADPAPLFSTRSGDATANWLGPTGAFLSEATLRLFGVIGFSLPVVFFFAGRRRLAAPPEEGGDPTAVRVVILSSLAVSVTGLAALAGQLFSGGAPGEGLWGGYVGALLASSLSHALNPSGAGLVLVALGLVSYGALVGWNFRRDRESAEPGRLTRWGARVRKTWIARRERRAGRREARRFVARIHRRRRQPTDPPPAEAEDAEDAGEREIPAPVPRPVEQPALLSPTPEEAAPARRRSKKRAAAAAAPEPAPEWKLPSLQLLTRRAHQPGPAKKALEERRKALETACAEYGVRGQVERIQPGPVITTFEFRLGEGETLKKLAGRHEELCMALHAAAIRVQRVRGKGVVGIEVPNEQSSVVGLREVLEAPEFQEEKGALPVGIGRLVDGRPLVLDLAEMPHLLVAGATGAGKSVCINTLLCSLLSRRTPDELRLILIDPKRVELRPYRNLPHLLTPVILEPEKAKTVLFHACRELDRRTRVLEQHGMRNIAGYNQYVRRLRESAAGKRGKKKEQEEAEIPQMLPRLVIVVDELADLFIHAKAEVTPSIQRLLSLGRAEGIHLVVATQRPSTDIVSGTLKANLPSRIAFRVASYVDSRTILDTQGAELLLGKGDMLLKRPGADLPRAQGALVDEKEVGRLAKFWESLAEPVFDEGMLAETEAEEGGGAGARRASAGANGAAGAAGGAGTAPAGDSLLPQARELIVREQKASTSMLQTELGLGYQRARRIIADLERQGVVGPQRGASPREVLVQP